MTIKNTAIAVSTETADVDALEIKITKANVVLANDIEVLTSVVENHNAKLHRVLALIEEFDLSAKEVAVIYETRDSFGDSDAPSLAALARTITAFPEFSKSESDDIATEIIEACDEVYRSRPTWKLYPDTVLKMIIETNDEGLMSFFQAADFLVNGRLMELNEDGEVIFNDD